MTPLAQIQQAQSEGRAEGDAMLAQLRATQVSHDVTERSFARLPIVSSTPRKVSVPAPIATNSDPAPVTFWPAQEIADFSQVSLTDLHAIYRPRHWREGEHWVRVHGVLMYRSPDICELVGEIALHPTSARIDAARRLMTWLVARGEHTVMPGHDEIAPANMPRTEHTKPWWQRGQFE